MGGHGGHGSMPYNGMYATYPPQPQPIQQQQLQQQQSVVVAVDNGHLNGVINESKENEKDVSVVNKNNNTENVNFATKKNKKYLLLYDNEMVSMEEQRFAHSEYHWTPKQVKECNEKDGDVEMDKNEDIDLYQNL